MSEAKVFPRRLSFSKICDILIGYLNAGADNQFVGVSEVVEKSNVTLHNISRNNNFLKTWNFIEEKENEPGKYKLNREAAEFAYAYRIDPNGEQTRLLLNKILSKYPVLTAFVERIRRENLSRDTALIELPRVIGDLRADKVGLTAFLDMTAYAFGLEELSTQAKIAKPLREIRRTPRALTKTEASAQTITVKSPTANISINLTISPDVTPEKLKEYIKVILEAYDEHHK